MALVDQLGTSMLVGGQTVFSSYITKSEDLGELDLGNEEFENNDGLPVGMIITKRRPLVKLSLLSKAGATPTTDMPKGGRATSAMGTYSGWFVNSMSAPKVAKITEVTSELLSLGY